VLSLMVTSLTPKLLAQPLTVVTGSAHMLTKPILNQKDGSRQFKIDE